MSARSCPNCGAPVASGVQFCPECGVRLEAAATDADEVLEETEPLSVRFRSSTPRYFGVTSPTLLFGIAAAALALAILLLATAHVVLGAILLVAAALALALFVQIARRLPDTAVARVSVGALDAARARAGFALETLAAQSEARRRLLPLQHELMELAAARAEGLRELGEAVYGGDSDSANAVKERVRELDEQIAAKEGQMAQIAASAQERVAHARGQIEPTEAVEPPPMPEPLPEPSPPPVPPTPAPTPPEPE